MWSSQDNVNMTASTFKSLCKNKINDYYTKQWSDSINNSSKCTLYKELKYEFGLCSYLIQVDPRYRTFLTRIRTCNHRLPIEKGRFIGLTRAERICNLCDLNMIGDEYHYLCICTRFCTVRNYLLEENLLKQPSMN